MDPLIVAIYGLLAVAAMSRSAVQLIGHGGDAPVAYALSATAAGCYAVAWLTLRGATRSASLALIARAVCTAELAGVLIVGTLTIIDPALFPDDTVWSGYGMGYGFAPLVLPAVALGALHRMGRRHLTAVA